MTELCDICEFANKETKKCYTHNCFDGKSFTKFQNILIREANEKCIKCKEKIKETFKPFIDYYDPFIVSDEHEEKWFCRHCLNRRRDGHLESCSYLSITKIIK